MIKKKINLIYSQKVQLLQSTLIIEDYSSCNFIKNEKLEHLIKQGLKISKKNIVCEDNYWKISAAHDGYFQKFNLIHERNYGILS